MDTKRDNAAARTVVTRLLKQYFENLRTRLAAGTAQFWGRIEQRLVQKPAASDLEAPSGAVRTPVQHQPVQQQPLQQQPLQQQQAKTESKDDK